MTIKPKNGSLYRFGDYKAVRMAYTVGYNWTQWHYTNLIGAKRKARELLGVNRLHSTQPFACGPDGDRIGVLYYRTIAELRDDQDGSKGIQVEKWYCDSPRSGNCEVCEDPHCAGSPGSCYEKLA